MNCIRSLTDLKEQRQLLYAPAYQKDTKEGAKEMQEVAIAKQDPIQLFVAVVYAYKGRQIPEFEVNLGQR